jgi:hypothetical protein
MEFSIKKVGKGDITPTELLHLVNHMEHTNQHFYICFQDYTSSSVVTCTPATLGVFALDVC